MGDDETDRRADSGAGPVLASLARPRAPEPVTLAVVADPHVAVGRTGTWKVAHRSRARFRLALADALARGVDAVVLPGDLTGDGRPGSFEAVDAELQALDAAGVPWLALPGNHDVPKAFDDHDAPPVDAFQRRYTGLPAVREVGPLTLVGVNTATDGGDLRETWGGRFGTETRAWLRERLPALDRPVVVSHHSLARFAGAPDGKWDALSAADAPPVRELYRECGVELALSAHQHVPAASSHGAFTELVAPATCSFPHASLLVEVGPDGTTARLVPLAGPEGLREGRRLARTGKPLAVGVLGAVERRLDRLPLVDER